MKHIAGTPDLNATGNLQFAFQNENSECWFWQTHQFFGHKFDSMTKEALLMKAII